MIYGKKFLLGLLAASSWALPVTVHAAADSTPAKWSAGAAPSANSSTDEAAQLARQAAAIAQQSGRIAFAAPTSPNSATIAPNGSTIINAAADNTSSAWKRTDTTPAADIRFKKPSTAIATDQDAQPAEQAVKKPAIQQQQVAALAAAVPAPAATVVAAPVVATPAPAVSTALYASPAQTAAAPNRDNQVQLVSRILDADVRHAAEDEPLPAVSQDERMNVNNGMNGNNGNNGNNHTNNNDANRNNVYDSDGACCDTGCCAPQPCLFWTAGVEATFLNPDLNSNGGVSFEVEQIDEQRDDICSSESSAVDSLYMSPRIWLGVQGCCWGVDVRYWHLQASEGAYDPSIGGLGSWDGYDCGQPDFGFFTCSRLEAYTVDLELTRRFCLNDCQMQAAIGVRHADLEASEGVTGLAATDQGILNGFARANRHTSGTGFLLGLYGRKPLYPCSCVNWFYNARWSAMWGPTQTATETFAEVQSTDQNFTASAGSVNGAYTAFDDTLFIGEIQLGLEWDYALRCLPANAFFRAAVEYQRWDGGMGSSAANSFAGMTVVQQVDPTSIVRTQASALAPQMDLLGFTLGTGLTW